MENLAQLALAKREESQSLQREGGDRVHIERLLREAYELFGELAVQDEARYIVDFIWQGYYLANHLYEEDNFAEARAISLPALSALEGLSISEQKQHLLLHSLLLNQIAGILCEMEKSSFTVNFFKEKQAELSEKLSAHPMHLCALLLDIKRILAIEIWEEDEDAAEQYFLQSYEHAKELYNQLDDSWKNEFYCASEELADFYDSTNRPELALPYKNCTTKANEPQN